MMIFSEDENSSVASDSEYIPPQRLRGGCDDDNYDEGEDIQFAMSLNMMKSQLVQHMVLILLIVMETT